MQYYLSRYTNPKICPFVPHVKCENAHNLSLSHTNTPRAEQCVREKERVRPIIIAREKTTTNILYLLLKLLHTLSLLLAALVGVDSFEKQKSNNS